METMKKSIILVVLLAINISAFLDLKGIKDKFSSERQQTYPITEGSSTGECNHGCQAEWIPFNGSCYKKIATSATFATAESHCQQLNSHLASIGSADEATTIKRLVLDSPFFEKNLTRWTSTSQNVWIGLSKGKNGPWKWSDSSSVTFTNLAEGISDANAACVYIDNTALAAGAWKSTECSTSMTSFVCKKIGAAN